MDASEALVKVYLESVGFAQIQYEPDGNVPPDFLADGRVAVEVRRLNQNHDDGTGRGPRGLEEVAIPLWNRVRDYLITLGPAPASGQSWFVFYRFGRPIPLWKTLKQELDAVLIPFMSTADPHPFEVKLSSGVELSVIRATTPKATFFRPAGHVDKQSGGFLISEIASNLKLCITEKELKIASFRTKYPEWWLVLPDHIGYGLDDFDRELFRDQVNITHNFDKVVLLDPRDAGRWFEV